MTENRNSAISRWSRLKQREKQGGDKAEETPGRIVQQPPEGGELLSGRDPDQSAVVEQLPDIETLEEASDFTVFLKEGVPEALRRQALRKLWRLNPVFANLDGLNDYDEDFTIVTTLAENLKTVYQVGKGMPDPEPAEQQEGDDPQPGEDDETAEVTPHESEPEPAPDDTGETPESEAKFEALETSEPSLAGVPPGRTEEPESAQSRGRERKPESSAARRRWAAFTS